MIYKEQNILFPICAENFSTEEWYQIYKDTEQYEEIFGVERVAWTEAESALAAKACLLYTSLSRIKSITSSVVNN